MKRRINESQDGERIIRFCKDALNDALSLVNSDDVDSHVIDEIIDTLKDRISILEAYLREKEAKAASSFSENQKVTLTLGQLKHLIKESSNKRLNESDDLSETEIRNLVDTAFETLDDGWYWGTEGRGEHHKEELAFMRAFNKIINGDPSLVIKQIIEDADDDEISESELLAHKDFIAKIAAKHAKEVAYMYCNDDTDGEDVANNKGLIETCKYHGISPRELPPFFKDRYRDGSLIKWSDI